MTENNFIQDVSYEEAKKTVSSKPYNYLKSFKIKATLYIIKIHNYNKQLVKKI